MEVELVGGKFNLTDVAARVGLGQLPHLDEFNAKRRELARAYFELLEAPAMRFSKCDASFAVSFCESKIVAS